jgi:hypothetical protein
MICQLSSVLYMSSLVVYDCEYEDQLTEEMRRLSEIASAMWQAVEHHNTGSGACGGNFYPEGE